MTKPVLRKSGRSSAFINVSNSKFGSKNTITKVNGSVKKIGVSYNDAIVSLFNKDTMRLVSSAIPNKHGEYQFNGLSGDMECFIVSFDLRKQFNAVIQDNVVPK